MCPHIIKTFITTQYFSVNFINHRLDAGNVLYYLDIFPMQVWRVKFCLISSLMFLVAKVGNKTIIQDTVLL